jgi:hypothetical protein
MRGITMTHIRLTVIRADHRMPCLDCGKLTHRRVQSQAFRADVATHRAYDNPVCARVTCG